MPKQLTCLRLVLTVYVFQCFVCIECYFVFYFTFFCDIFVRLKHTTLGMRQLKITKSITNRESASLEKYLQEIGKVDLITAEEEVVLAKENQDGRPTCAREVD
jgi:hypothetical protein